MFGDLLTKEPFDQTVFSTALNGKAGKCGMLLGSGEVADEAKKYASGEFGCTDHHRHHALPTRAPRSQLTPRTDTPPVERAKGKRELYIKDLTDSYMRVSSNGCNLTGAKVLQ